MKLIFIHGSGGCKDAWHYQLKYFPDADAVNLPGHPDGEPHNSIEGYVDWLREYIQQNGYRDVVLAGHSLGGAVAQLYALKYPDDLKGLVLIGTGARLRVHPMYLEEFEKAKNDPTILEQMRETGMENIDPELKELLKKRALEVGAAVFLNDMLCCDRFDIMDRVHEIKLPALALCGSEDVMTPPKYIKYLADKIDGATEVIIPGATHNVPIEKPDEVNQAITDFLQSIPS